MNNPYTASFEHVRDLNIDYHRRRTRDRFEELRRRLTREQIAEQLDNGNSEVIEVINAAVREEGQRSETVEVVLALQLADFYFPSAPKEISFDLRRGVDPASITTFEELIAAFEDHTHVDCLVRSGDQEISFQLKRYRGPSTPEDFVEWLNSRVLQHYGDMSGTALVVLLQASGNAEHPLALDRLYELFVRDALPNVSFDSISLTYNDATSGHFALHELHPRHHRRLIEVDLALARARGDA